MSRMYVSSYLSDIEGPHMVKYYGTFDTERQKKQREQIKSTTRNYSMSTRQNNGRIMI
jgi:hypothetical protein